MDPNHTILGNTFAVLSASPGYLLVVTVETTWTFLSSAKSLGEGVCAVMADMRHNVTMQGFGNPVSAAGQGEKAGPQSSSSCDRSSLIVGNLAMEEYNATRIFHFRSGDQECKVKKRDCFCYICSKYEDPKNRRKFNEKHKQQYHELFGIDSTVDESDWVPKTICALCRKMLGSKKTEVKMKVPTIWKEPFEKRDCYFCNTNLLGINSRVKSKIKYANVKSVTKPVYLSRIQEEEVSLDSFASEHMDVEQNLETDADESLVEEIERVPDEEGFTENDESIDDDTDVVSASDDEEYTPNNAENSKGPIAQEHVNDLIRDLGLPKDGAEYLASWLKGNTNVADKIKVSYY